MRLNISLLVVVLVASMGATPVMASDSKTADAARQAVEKYCQADFVGWADIRLDIAKFSPKREAMERKKGDPHMKPGVIFLGASPLFVVSSYHILDVTVQKNRGLATVAYERLARTEGEEPANQKIIPEYVEREFVKLELVYEKGRWLILDPPLPRVHIDPIISVLEKDIKFDDERFKDPKTAELAQTTGYFQTYLNDKENLMVLKKLKAESKGIKSLP